MRKIKIFFCISFLIVSILSGCGKQKPNIDLSNIDISNIDKIVGQVYRIQMMKRITALSNTVILTFYA